MNHPARLAMFLSGLLLPPAISSELCATELIPPLTQIKADRPRVLLRPEATACAISFGQLRAIPQDAQFKAMLDQLRRNRSAAAQAMVWLLTDEKEAADRAIARMRDYRYPGDVDTFHIYFRLREFGLAYDWLYDYPGFTHRVKAEVRANVNPLARHGLRIANDHMFHNYVWMSAGGAVLWSLATAGEDEQADRLFEQTRRRFNTGLLPAMEYLDGLPSEPMGYWTLYDLSPCALAILATQSGFETDVVRAIREKHNDWLRRHFRNLIHSTLPNRRFVPWGDLQSGPNGGVTMEVAGISDGLSWALKSPQGAYFSRWIAEKESLRRFYGEEAVFYMLYTRNITAAPAEPPLSFLAGGSHSGHLIARSGWDEGATIVTFRCTDHFGDHNHYDQGSFAIYRNGLLAVDPPVYRRIRGPQQKTENHNTLLLGGKPQRPVRGQWFATVEDFQRNLHQGRKLETGDVLFYKDTDTWVAVAGQFAQAYPDDLVQSCIRQLLFVRPSAVVVVDQLVAPAERDLPKVQWLLQVPKEPTLDGTTLLTYNGSSWLRCRPILPDASAPAVEATKVNTHCASFNYGGGSTLLLIHLLEVGDGGQPTASARVDATQTETAIEVTLGGKTFVFARRPPFAVTEKTTFVDES